MTREIRDVRSFGIWRGVGWQQVTNVSGEPIGPNLKGQVVKEDVSLTENKFKLNEIKNVITKHCKQYEKQLKNKRPTWCHLLFYFTSYALNMFRTLIYPSSGACDCVAELPHRSSCSQFVVCWRFGVAGFWVVSVLQAEAQLQPAKRTPPNISRNKTSNTQRTENKTTDVVIHQHSRRLLKRWIY